MKYRYLYYFVFLMLGLLSCKSTNSPKAVTETFLVSVARLDIPTARNYSTRQTWSFLKVLEQDTKDMSEEQKEAYLNKFSVNILSETKVNDSMYKVAFSTTPELFPFDTLDLVAEKNLEGDIRWKIDLNSFDFMQSDTAIQEIMIPGVEPDEEPLESQNAAN